MYIFLFGWIVRQPVTDIKLRRMAYIEENLKLRMKSKDNPSEPGPADPDDELSDIAQRWKVEKKNTADEGSVTNSLSMLTAIPEVDLGMECVIN